ncbi:MAG: YgiW/YdeI family stress tolerance OB fold protein [Deltaproteobacteria bacterium]|jgi:uncharacterized protein (TIGR00156 family)|nr:YgiW/YdeI family stress tolerance OB fold protein [Deltaproteobacteria bacterium]
MLKHIVVALFVSVVFLAAQAMAQEGFQGPSNPAAAGGFKGPGITVSTVQQALQMRDDAYVILQGNITQHLGKDRYLFQDSTNQITVDIDNNKWNGVTVTPTDRVEIRGEIDKDFMNIEVDVDSIVLL